MTFFVNVCENGVDRLYPTHCTNGDDTPNVRITEQGKSITLQENVRLEFLDSTDSKNDWAFFNLYQHTLSFDVYLGNTKKGHNLAFYSCQLTKGQEYKDAQTWYDSRCEIDFMEANRTAYHYTSHKAYDRGGNQIMGIGGWGTQPFQSDSGLPLTELYGPKKFIDTFEWFHVKLFFFTNRIRLELRQGEHIIWAENGSAYYEELKDQLIGTRHTLVMSIWSGPMDWLDGNLPSYDESFIKINVGQISNITLDSIIE